MRIFYPSGRTTTLYRFPPSKKSSVWCWCNLQLNQHNLVFGKTSGFTKQAAAEQQILILEISPSVFHGLATHGHLSMREFSKRVKKGKSFSLSAEPLFLDGATQQCVLSVLQMENNREGSNLLVYARVVELLWLQQQNYMQSQTPRVIHVKTEYDKERIVFARDYLLTHMDAPPTLHQLASIAGINEFKLKRGFRELFHQSVFAYLADVRLDMAQRALREKQKSVTQIAFQLGYASLQHFSAAFKKKFGVSPAKFSAI